MKHIVVLALSALFVTSLAVAQDCENQIGIYFTQTPTDAGDEAAANFTGSVGLATGYVILWNPVNARTGNPVSVVGGWECRLNLPPGSQLLGVTSPSGINPLTLPDISMGCTVPVVGGQANLGTLTMVYGGVPGGLYTSIITSVQPSIPGNLAFADKNDNYSITAMYPISGSMDSPVAGFNTPVTLDGCYSTPQWSVMITDGTNDLILGADSAASDVYDDAFDIPATPGAAMVMPRPEWNTIAVDFRRDIRADYDLMTESKDWDFSVTTASTPGGEIVSLDFEPAGLPVTEFDLVLTDHVTGLSQSVLPDLRYAYSTAGGTRDFTLRIGPVQPQYSDPSIVVSASSNGFSDTNNIAATNELATDGYDAGIDIPEPTPPPSGYVSVSFEHADWPLGPRFCRDIRSPLDPMTDGKTWPLMVETDQTGQITLTFTPNFTSDSEMEIMLRDLQSGQVFRMFPDLSYVFDSTGPGTYRFELSIVTIPVPEFDPTSRNLPAGWSLVAPPLTPNAGEESLESVLLDQVPGYGYAFSFAATSGYTLVDGTAVTGPGSGYWLATDTGFTWTMSGDINRDPVSIGLAQGWNLIGYPLWFPGPVEGIRVAAGGVTYTWEDALLVNLVSGFLGYDNPSDDYVSALNLDTWHGYWVAAMQPGVSLTFDWPNFLDPPLRLTKEALPTPEPVDHWRTILSFDDGSGSPRSATLGAEIGATDGFDAKLDLPRPPATPSGGATLALQRPEWQLASGASLVSDIVAPLDGRDVEWTVRITPRAPGRATLGWKAENWPRDLDLELYNPSENRVLVRSMAAVDHIDLDLGTGAIDLVVRTQGQLSGVDRDVPFADYALAAHPNPFNPATTLGFSLPRAGNAEVRIYSVRGELVAIVGGETLPAGYSEFQWRGTDREGRSVPSGSYFARLMLDGRHVGDTAKMSLVR